MLPLIINKRGKLADWSTNRVIFPTFELYSNPTIRISDVKRRRFNLIDRAVQTAKQQIMEQQDADIFAKLDDLIIEKE